MSVSYGFYNSIGGDRKYDATQISSLFDGMINDGVYESIGGKLAVSATTGMNVKVASGRAWFNHTWTYNDSDLILPLSAAEVGFNRIDMVVLEVDTSEAVRANSIKIVKGTPATSPVEPTLTSTAFVHQYPLACIYVGAGVTSIVTGNITNKIGTVACPYATGILRTVDTTSLDNLQTSMNSLNSSIGTVNNKLNYIVTTGTTNTYIVTYTQNAPTSYTAGMMVRIKTNFSNTAAASININGLGSKSIYKQGPDGIIASVASDLINGQIYDLIYDGTYFILLNPTTSAMIGSKQIFTSSGTFTAPRTGIYKVTVTGGGGSGGRDSSGYGGGGGAGGTAIKYVTLTSGQAVTVTVGSGGSSPSSNSLGNGGGSSSFGAFCSATGGTGGTVSTNGSQWGYGGNGSNGDINIPGGCGVNNGTLPLNNGGASYWGGGGTLLNSMTSSKGAYGSGGGGAASAGDSSSNQGCAGQTGIVMVEW